MICAVERAQVGKLLQGLLRLTLYEQVTWPQGTPREGRGGAAERGSLPSHAVPAYVPPTACACAHVPRWIHGRRCSLTQQTATREHLLWLFPQLTELILAKEQSIKPTLRDCFRRMSREELLL